MSALHEANKKIANLESQLKALKEGNIIARNAAREQQKVVKALTDTEAELTSCKKECSDLQKELSSVKKQLAEVQAELTETLEALISED
tara:strand:+ start:1053 stop:1319 length:267 start_codon:yes stop_codon:yes gene_type:complete